MARLPSAEDLGQRPTPQSGRAISGYDGGQVARAMQGAGQVLGQIADKWQQEDDAQAVHEARRKLNDWERSSVFDPEKGAVAKRGKDAFDLPKTLTEDFDKFSSEVGGSLANKRQKAAFAEIALSRRSQIGAWADGHALKQREVFHEGQYQADMKDFEDRAVLYAADPTKVKTELALQNERTVGYLRGKGQSEELIAAAVKENAKLAHEAVSSELLQEFEGLLVGEDEDGAKAYLNANRERMTGKNALSAERGLRALRNQNATEAERQAAKAERERDKALKEAERTVDELRDFWIGGGSPELGYIAEVQSKTQGTPFEAAANAMINQAQKGAAHGASTLPRQEASIRAMEAALANGSNPDAEKTLAYARQVTDRQKAEYKENPWAAGARFARLPSVPDAPLPKAEMAPEYIKQVLPIMDEIEAASGMPASPFQPAQAWKLAQDLQALPVADRAAVLGQTGEQLTIQRIAALADQLDKGNRPLSLALKLGAGRTTLDRAVQETMLRGADAIKDKTVKRDDAVLTGWRAEITQMVRGTLGDAQAEQDVIDAAYYTRAGMDEPGYPGKAGNETAVKLVIGQPLERGGVRTILPRGMDEDTFTDKLREYTPEKLRSLAPAGEVYFRGQKRTLAQLSSALPGMGLRRNGAGQYAPIASGAMVTLDPQGQIPLLLEVR